MIYNTYLMKYISNASEFYNKKYYIIWINKKTCYIAGLENNIYLILHT